MSSGDSNDPVRASALADGAALSRPTLTGILAGVLIGLILTGAVSLVIDLLLTTYQLDKAWGSMLKILVGICFCYLGVTLVPAGAADRLRHLGFHHRPHRADARSPQPQRRRPGMTAGCVVALRVRARRS